MKSDRANVFFCFRVPCLSLWNENLMRTQINIRTCCRGDLINYLISEKNISMKMSLGKLFLYEKGKLMRTGQPMVTDPQ